MLKNYKFHHRLIIALLPGIALLVIGCTVPVKEKLITKIILTEPTPGAKNLVMRDFSLQGRVSFLNQHQRTSGTIHWQHTPNDDEISLFSPLGQTLAIIKNDADGAYLTTAEKKNYQAPDVENLTEQVLGWRLPLSGLQYWVLGEHAPATVSTKSFDHNGQVVAIQQDGWHITYEAYFSTHNAQATHPRIIELNYKDLRIRLVVDNWNQDF